MLRESLLSISWLLLPSKSTAFVLPDPRRDVTARHDGPADVSATSSSTIALSLTCKEAHAFEVFTRLDADGDGAVTVEELVELLQSLDIESTQDDATALFRYLDENQDGKLEFDDEFLPWYVEATTAAEQVSESFQQLIIGRRTVEEFDQTPVSDDILRRAVQCAIAAPNRSMSEPWRFITVGPQTVQALYQLNQARLRQTMETDSGATSVVDWREIPGWCVVTSQTNNNDAQVELDDYKSTCCAIQNFMLSMWADGVGTKWTSGPVQKTQEFAQLCGIDTQVEKVVGCIWYGFASGGTKYADPRRRKKTVDDVLSRVP